MGSGALKTLSSDKIPHHQFLYVFSCGSHSSKPFVRLLLWRLSIGSCRCYLFFFSDASVIHYGFAPLGLSQGPVPLSVIWSVPRMLGTIATQMSLFMASVTLNFA